MQKRTPLNWILVNLAISDATIGAFGAPMSATAALVFSWPFGELMCLGYAFFMSITGNLNININTQQFNGSFWHR